MWLGTGSEIDWSRWKWSTGSLQPYWIHIFALFKSVTVKWSINVCVIFCCYTLLFVLFSCNWWRSCRVAGGNTFGDVYHLSNEEKGRRFICFGRAEGAAHISIRLSQGTSQGVLCVALVPLSTTGYWHCSSYDVYNDDFFLDGRLASYGRYLLINCVDFCNYLNFMAFAVSTHVKFMIRPQGLSSECKFQSLIKVCVSDAIVFHEVLV